MYIVSSDIVTALTLAATQKHKTLWAAYHLRHCHMQFAPLNLP